MKIFHIIKKDDWEAAKSAGIYEPETVKKGGFVHCSKTDQILGVANRFYLGQKDLLLLKIDVDKIENELRIEVPVEAPWSNVPYPHIYGALNIDAVDKAIEFPCGKDGKFELPDLFG